MEPPRPVEANPVDPLPRIAGVELGFRVSGWKSLSYSRLH
jgi:hypothetical protein